MFIAEVHSGRFECTINKCVISIIEQLHLYRLKDSNMHTYTSFAFPKLGSTRKATKSLIKI